MNRIASFILDRLPDKTSLLNVYAVIVTITFGWTIMNSFWIVSSWLFFLNLAQVASLYAYLLAFDFVESLLILAACMAISLILPPLWWKEKFTSRSTALLVIVMGSLFLSAYQFRDPDTRERFVAVQLVWWVVTLGCASIFAWLAGRTRWLGRGLENIADRCVVFLYVYIPLSAISILVVLMRNIF